MALFNSYVKLPEGNMCTRDSKACWIQWSILIGLASMRVSLIPAFQSLVRCLCELQNDCDVIFILLKLRFWGCPVFIISILIWKNKTRGFTIAIYSMIWDMRNKDKGLFTKAVPCYNNTNWELSKHTLGIWSNTCILHRLTDNQESQGHAYHRLPKKQEVLPLWARNLLTHLTPAKSGLGEKGENWQKALSLFLAARIATNYHQVTTAGWHGVTVGPQKVVCKEWLGMTQDDSTHYLNRWNWWNMMEYIIIIRKEN